MGYLQVTSVGFWTVSLLCGFQMFPARLSSAWNECGVPGGRTLDVTAAVASRVIPAILSKVLHNSLLHILGTD